MSPCYVGGESHAQLQDADEDGDPLRQLRGRRGRLQDAALLRVRRHRQHRGADGVHLGADEDPDLAHHHGAARGARRVQLRGARPDGRPPHWRGHHLLAHRRANNRE